MLPKAIKRTFFYAFQPGHDSKKDGNMVQDKYLNVAYHASRISNNYYQVVLVDRQNDIQKAIDVANKAYDIIVGYNDLEGSGRFYVWVETSGTGPPSVFKTYELVTSIYIIQNHLILRNI